MKTLHIDLETFSSVDITSAGAHKYVDSADFEILLFSYAIDDSPVVKIDLATGEIVPEWLISALHDPEYVKMAHNAEFEFLCLSKYYGAMIPSQWRCTQLHALYRGYPSSLDAVGKALGMAKDKQKLKIGKDLIRFFSIPQRDGSRNTAYEYPEKWKLYGEYNMQDVEAEREIERILSACPVPDFVQKQWETNLKINLRGVQIDRRLAENAIIMGLRASSVLSREAQELTGLDNPKSVAQVKRWLSESGIKVDSLGKNAVKDLLAKGVDNDIVRAVLENRQELCKSSTKKYDKMLECICSDGRLHGMLAFYGANRSGRYCGKLVQPQNLPRTYVDLELLPLTRNLIKNQQTAAIETLIGPVLDTLSQLIRTVFIPSEGNTLIDCDFSAIEARVISWVAGEDWRIKAFENGEDIYCSTASRMFGVPVEKHGRNKHLRQQGKVAELACGYQGSVGAMRRMDVGHALDNLSDAEMKQLVDQWRYANPRIVKMWYDCQNAAAEVIRNAGTVSVCGKLIFRRERNPYNDAVCMTIELPSGRKLFYLDPIVGENRFGGESITYMGVDQQTKQWARQESYGGKLVENCIQAIARDCLAESIEKLEDRGFPVVFHIHDEVVIDMNTNGKDAERLEDVIKIMSEVPSWASGLPLTGDGWTGQFFRKD